MPLWGGYDDELSSKIADINNVSASTFAGAIIGALFLRRFVTATAATGCTWTCTPGTRRNGPGRPVGAEAQAVRALYALLVETLRLRPAVARARMDLRFERRAWTLVYLCLGLVEGGTAAVMVRALFGSAVAGVAVDLVVAVVSRRPPGPNREPRLRTAGAGSPEDAFLRPLLLAMAVCVAALGLLPAAGAGCWPSSCSTATARLLWAGVETVRAVIWSVNYPRQLRARITGRIMVQRLDRARRARACCSAGCSSTTTLVSGGDPGGRRRCGLAGSVAFGRFRVRQEQRLLADERARLREGARFDLAGMRELLARDATSAATCSPCRCSARAT